MFLHFLAFNTVGRKHEVLWQLTVPLLAVLELLELFSREPLLLRQSSWQPTSKVQVQAWCGWHAHALRAVPVARPNEDKPTQLFLCMCLHLFRYIFIPINAGRTYGKCICAYLFVHIHAYLWVCISLSFLMQLM